MKTTRFARRTLVGAALATAFLAPAVAPVTATPAMAPASSAQAIGPGVFYNNTGQWQWARRDHDNHWLMYAPGGYSGNTDIDAAQVKTDRVEYRIAYDGKPWGSWKRVAKGATIYLPGNDLIQFRNW